MREELRKVLWRGLIIMVGGVAVFTFLYIFWHTHSVTDALEGGLLYAGLIFVVGVIVISLIFLLPPSDAE